MAACCGNKAQHRGVENERQNPHIKTLTKYSTNTTKFIKIIIFDRNKAYSVILAQQERTVRGAVSTGLARRNAVFSKTLIIAGGMNIAGAAMPIREGTTCQIIS